jgi:DNA-binding transcriptional MerR regulator
MGMLRLYSEEDIARLRLIKYLVGDLGLNLAGVQLAMAVFNRLLNTSRGMRSLEGKALKNFVGKSLEEMLELLHGAPR